LLYIHSNKEKRESQSYKDSDRSLCAITFFKMGTICIYMVRTISKSLFRFSVPLLVATLILLRVSKHPLRINSVAEKFILLLNLGIMLEIILHPIATMLQ
jgi:hypothetical protein